MLNVTIKLAAMAALTKAKVSFRTPAEALLKFNAARGGELAKKLAIAILGQEVVAETASKVKLAEKSAKVRSVKLRKGVKTHKRHRRVAKVARATVILFPQVSVDKLSEQSASTRARYLNERRTKVAIRGYVSALDAVKKASDKVEEASRSTIVWSVKLLKAMSRLEKARLAVLAAEASL